METENNSDITVLIVDDNENNLQIAAKVVSKAGFRVLLAQDGASALEITSEITPDVILLDIMMPDMDGLEVCRRLMKRPEFIDIPVIFLSAKDEDISIEEGLLIGGTDYVTKPFSERVLLARLRSHIDRRIYQKKLKELNKELEAQIEKNIQVFAVLNDQIRNPLCAAVLTLEMIDDKNAEKVIENLQRINKVVDDLDKGFIDSEKVLNFLHKHHGIPFSKNVSK